jgi:hypothetical protein
MSSQPLRESVAAALRDQDAIHAHGGAPLDASIYGPLADAVLAVIAEREQAVWQRGYDHGRVAAGAAIDNRLAVAHPADECAGECVTERRMAYAECVEAALGEKWDATEEPDA